MKTTPEDKVMKTTQHQIVIQAETDGEWLDIEVFDCNNRYLPTKEQRGQISALKYELSLTGNKIRTIKRKEIVK